MMSRWTLLCVYGLAGVAALGCGLLIPAHLRAVDSRVIQRAGRNTPGLVERGLMLVRQKNAAAAQLVLRAAEMVQLPGRENLDAAIDSVAKQNPLFERWSEAGPLARFAASSGPRTNSGPVPFTEFIIRTENREKALELLEGSQNAAVQELLRFRSVTNTAVFPPSQSASGQALDAAVSICGLLLMENHFDAGMSNTVAGLATEANRGGNPQPFEDLLVDLMSLGQRFDWGQLTEFVSRIDDGETLHRHAGVVRAVGRELPLLFAAVELSGDSAGVARYAMAFSQTGLRDLGTSLRSGSGGVNELLKRNQRVDSGQFTWSLLLGSCLHAPVFALMVKWFLYLAGGFLLALALHLGKPAPPVLERPLQVRGFHVAREVLFALGFLLVVLLVSEPFLAQNSQRVEMPFRLRLPTVGSTVHVGNAGIRTSFMNQTNLLTMLLFFVLQGLLYTACVVKLAEIRRQRVPARMKLRLLENEEHLFDAGLYLGFLGTIVSFILYSLNQAHQFSLMVAYSSTSFGILFVSFFKIFHLRRVRRKLLLEAEAAPAEAVPQRPAAHPLAAPL